MSSINLKTTTIDKESSSVDPFSQLGSVLNKETSFIQVSNLLSKRKSPSVLLKHNVSKISLNNTQIKQNLNNNFQKSKSTPFLNTDKPAFNSSNLCSKYQNGNFDKFMLTSTPNLFRNYGNFDKKSNLIESSNLEFNHSNDPLSSKESDSSYNRALAIKVRDVSFDFKNSKLDPSNILKNVNLTCQKGAIYGLLGPSGCGKTTLIKLILGKYKPIAGQVKAFGYNVWEKRSGMIGSGVGYMPQELALIFDFTIEEQLYYFGRLYCMPREEIKREINYLCNILDLPEKERLLHHLSGGQQHRVSFACALIHRPRLMILDEPTVGLDPILRERIWLQMLSLTENEGTTILITTHYIEEAKRANTIGFLRKGELLVEQSPQFLMKKYQTSSLEKLFYKICIDQIKQKKSQDKFSHHIDVNFNNSVNEMIEESLQQEQNQSPRSSKSTDSTADINELNENINANNNENNNENNENDSNNDNEYSDSSSQPYLQTDNLIDELKSYKDADLIDPWIDRHSRSELSKWFIQFFVIVWKYFILTKRRPETILAQYVLPIVAISVFCVCIGSTPTGIKLAIINEEDCGYPLDLIDPPNPAQPNYENFVGDFVKRFEDLFFVSKDNSSKLTSEDIIKFNSKRSIEATTIDLNILNEEEEVTTYPSRFNLMNNINFNENKFDKIKNEKELSADENSIDRALRNKDVIVTTEEPSNHRIPHELVIRSNEINTTALINEEKEEDSTTEPSIILINSNNLNEKLEPPVPMAAVDKDASDTISDTGKSDEPTGSNNENEENEKLPKREEEDENLEVNSQFEDACFSQILIRKLNTFIFNKIPYTSHEKAIEDVRSGKIWGVMRIKKGFSRALLSKIMFQDYGNVNISDSIVDINADLTNRALIITLEVTLSRLYPELIEAVLDKANKINRKLNAENNTEFPIYNLNSGRLPIILGHHIFKLKFTLSDFFGVREFCAPGLFIILTYSISYALTVFSLVNEIGDKMFDRHQSIGLSSNQLIFSHLSTRFIFSATGIILVFLMSIYFFDIANHGSTLNAITLLLLQSYCAMVHGMLISVLCPSLFICAAISNGYLFFIFIISGVLWSFETLPPIMKAIGTFLPTSLPCESLRSIMTRGIGFESNTVIYGYVVTISWIIIHYILTLIVFNYRKNNK